MLDEVVVDVVDVALDEHPAVVVVDVLLELLPSHYSLRHINDNRTDAQLIN